MRIHDFLCKAGRLICVMLMVCLISPSYVSGQDRIPPSIARELNAVNDLLAEEKVAEAISRITAFQEKSRGHFLVSFTLANAFMAAKNFTEARKAYEKTIEMQNGYAPAWFNMAVCGIELKRYGEAADAFVKSYDLSSDKKPETLYYASNAYLTGGQYQMSLGTFNQLIANHGKDIKPEWKATLVQTFLALKQPLKALPVIQELARITTGEQKKQWQEMLLHQYLSLSMNQRALSYAERLAEEDPLEPKWWKSLVHINLLEDDYRDAMVALTVYGNLVALSIEEKKLMADLSLSLDIPVQSIKILEEILAVKWEPEILEKLVHGYRLRHQPEKALEWLEEGLKRDKHNSDLLMLKGNLLYAMAAYEKAMSAFDLLTRMDDAPGQAWLMLGYAAWNADKLASAHNAFLKASQFKAQRKLAEEAIRRLEKVKNTL